MFSEVQRGRLFTTSCGSRERRRSRAATSCKRASKVLGFTGVAIAGSVSLTKASSILHTHMLATPARQTGVSYFGEFTPVKHAEYSKRLTGTNRNTNLRKEFLDKLLDEGMTTSAIDSPLVSGGRKASAATLTVTTPPHSTGIVEVSDFMHGRGDAEPMKLTLSAKLPDNPVAAWDDHLNYLHETDEPFCSCLYLVKECDECLRLVTEMHEQSDVYEMSKLLHDLRLHEETNQLDSQIGLTLECMKKNASKCVDVLNGLLNDGPSGDPVGVDSLLEVVNHIYRGLLSLKFACFRARNQGFKSRACADFDKLWVAWSVLYKDLQDSTSGSRKTRKKCTLLKDSRMYYANMKCKEVQIKDLIKINKYLKAKKIKDLKKLQNHLKEKQIKDIMTVDKQLKEKIGELKELKEKIGELKEPKEKIGELKESKCELKMVKAHRVIENFHRLLKKTYKILHFDFEKNEEFENYAKLREHAHPEKLLTKLVYS